jgi:hypothetical protein
LLPVAGRYVAAVGQSFFGDLFLRDPDTGEYAILVASTLELVDTGEVKELEFRERILGNAEVIRTLLRPEDAAAIAGRLGIPSQGEALYPVPLPALGGSGDVGTFQKGGLWEYLGIVAQTLAGRG